MKSRAGMEALINDHQSLDMDVLLIQEPSTTVPKTCQPQCIATIPTDLPEQLGPILEPDLCQLEAVDILTPTSDMRPSGHGSSYNLDTRLLGPHLSSVYSARADTHARR
jgi:hypothetical protein